jgi:hypothetical protein
MNRLKRITVLSNVMGDDTSHMDQETWMISDLLHQTGMFERGTKVLMVPLNDPDEVKRAMNILSAYTEPIVR